MIPEGLAQVQGSSDVFGTGDGIVREYWNNRKANKGLAAGGDGGVGYWGGGGGGGRGGGESKHHLSRLPRVAQPFNSLKRKTLQWKREKQCAG